MIYNHKGHDNNDYNHDNNNDNILAKWLILQLTTLSIYMSNSPVSDTSYLYITQRRY